MIYNSGERFFEAMDMEENNSKKVWKVETEGGKDKTSSRKSFVGNTCSRKILMGVEPKNDSKN